MNRCIEVTQPQRNLWIMNFMKKNYHRLCSERMLSFDGREYRYRIAKNHKMTCKPKCDIFSPSEDISVVTAVFPHNLRQEVNRNWWIGKCQNRTLTEVLRVEKRPKSTIEWLWFGTEHASNTLHCSQLVATTTPDNKSKNQVVVLKMQRATPFHLTCLDHSRKVDKLEHALIQNLRVRENWTSMK